MKKRILSLVVVLTMLTTFMPCIHAAEIIDSGTCGDNLTWTLDNNGTLTISGTGDMGNYGWTGSPFFGNDNIKSVIINNGVTSICDGAFEWCHSLTSVTIPNSVTSIGNGAFNDCDSLTSVIIPNSVTRIGDYAFQNCSSLTNINVDNSNQYYCSIDGNLFSKDKKTLIQYAIGKTDINYTIPNSVTSIGDYAFNRCDDLTSVTISDNVMSIGEATFSDCVSLENISVAENNKNYCSVDGILFNKDKTTLIQYAIGKTDIVYIIPDSITRIGDYAFNRCSGLTSVIIPDSVTNIGINSFSNCGSLESVTIGNGVTSIGSLAFYRCYKLERVSIPANVTRIVIGAFCECYKLTNVYYSGTEAMWNKINIGGNNDNLLNATIHYSSTMPEPYNSPEQLMGKVKFATGKGSANFNYDDNYFSDSSYTYNHDLARISLRFAMSAFAKKTRGNEESYKTQYKNAKDLLTKLHYDDIWVNDDYEKIPSTNSIGVIIGNKRIAFDNGDYTVLAIGLRGGNYESEWGGNFTVGNGDFHEGFEMARDHTLQAIKDYINEYDITGNIKIWITGYSRAAATTNLTAGYIDTHTMIFGDKVSLKTEDIYAYCFEPPAGVHFSAGPQNNTRNNIFNIVNENDPVPKVVMSDWGYGRYGIDKYLPTSNNTSIEKYNDLKDAMLVLYNYYKGGEYLIDDFSKCKAEFIKDNKFVNFTPTRKQNEGIFFDNLLTKLGSTVVSPANYEKKYQKAFKYIGTEMIGEKKTDKFFESLKKNIQKKSPTLMTEAASGTIVSLLPLSAVAAYSTVRSIVTDTFFDLHIDVDDETIDAIVNLLLDLLKSGDIYTLLGNGTTVLEQPHYPELCLAWMDTIEETDLNDFPMRRICINCPVDVEVYNADGELTAAIINDEVDDNSVLPAMVTSSGEKVIYMPSNIEYSIKITATDNGSVSYSAKEPQTDGSVKVVSYSDIAVNVGDVLNGIAENAEETETTYAVEMSGNSIDPAVQTNKAVPVSISISADGNGNVIGGGIAYTGESVKITAVPFENEEFLGWYKGDELVSTDTSYDVLATDNMDFVAKFTENTCEVIVSDGKDIVSVYRINKGETVTLEENPQRERGIFKGYYSDENFSVEFDTNTVFNKDSTVYAKFEDAVKSGDWYYFVKSDGTAAIAGCDNIDEVLRIPNEIDGYTVTSLWYGAFNAEVISTVVIPESIKEIGEIAFANCDELMNVCYAGTETQWNEIVFNDGNDVLETAKLITDFNSDMEADIADVSVNNTEGLTVSVDFGYVFRKSTVYCAMYDTNNVLLSIKSAGAVAGTETVDFDMSDVYDFAKIKVFIWREDTMKPLAVAKEK